MRALFSFFQISVGVCWSTHANVKGEICRTLETMGVSHEARSERYLGLPVYMGRSRSKMFNYLKERVWKRIQGWQEKLLSRAGKETLIKAVAQAIPTQGRRQGGGQEP